MAKISPISIKYKINAKFSAEGAIEKPDVIGALFGQTEGLLGSELEMRELQKEGKIGRVEVSLVTENSKTTGDIEIPSALDKTETTIIAAALETIDRIGPTDAKIEIESIEDVRGSKRDYIIDRAKKLLEKIEESPDTKEMANNVKIGAREEKIQEYGKEKLPAGDISGEEIIVVEGRADVINLLRNNVNNVIGMSGTQLPETIKELSYDKEITLFIDGDRGGKLIAKNVIDNARIDFVVIAPDGKEVEELSGKEILSCLRKKIPVQEFLKILDRDRNGYNNYKRDFRRYRRDDFREKSFEKREEKIEEKGIKDEKIEELNDKQREKIQEIMGKVEGTKKAVFLDENLEEIKKVSVRSISSSLERARKEVYAIVLDGMVNSGIIRACEEQGVRHLAARNFGNVQESRINLVSL